MEKFAELINVLLQHSQRFLDFWNLQIVIAVAILGFVFSKPEVASRQFVRVTVTIIFVFIAIFSLFSLSVHQNREEKLYAALESRVMTTPAEFTMQEIEYLESLKPTNFGIKAGALVLAELLAIIVIWVNPQRKQKKV
jgi:hypothetical protein